MRSRLDARRRATAVKDWQSRFLELAEDQDPGSTRRLFEHYFGDRNISDYFSYRWGQPKLLATISLASLSPKDSGFSLDLGCGAGHLHRFLQARNPNHLSTGIDANFFLAWMAKSRIAPDGFFVCADVENGLPFRDDQFSCVILSNFLHFLKDKKYCIRESERVMRRDGLICASSIRHSMRPTETRNLAISPSEYGELFTAKPVSVPERNILDRYVAGRGPALGRSADVAILNGSPLISIVASFRKSVFQDHDKFTGQSTLAKSALKVNPLYEASDVEENLRYERKWPSGFFVKDNPWIDTYLPGLVEQSGGEWRGIFGNETTVDEDHLTRLCVLLDMPDNY